MKELQVLSEIKMDFESEFLQDIMQTWSRLLDRGSNKTVTSEICPNLDSDTTNSATCCDSNCNFPCPRQQHQNLNGDLKTYRNSIHALNSTNRDEACNMTEPGYRRIRELQENKEVYGVRCSKHLAEQCCLDNTNRQNNVGNLSLKNCQQSRRHTTIGQKDTGDEVTSKSLSNDQSYIKSASKATDMKNLNENHNKWTMDTKLLHPMPEDQLPSNSNHGYLLQAPSPLAGTDLMELPLANGTSDDKKRPLSVSSVTSSVSSSSSLPRHQRKKLATCAVTSLTTHTLNHACIDEDKNQNEALNIEEAKPDLYAEQTNVYNEKPRYGDIANQAMSLARDMSENFSENGSSDISDLSNLSGVSPEELAAYDTGDNLSSSASNNINSSKDDMTAKAVDSPTTEGGHNNACRRMGTVKPYRALCEPHGRAPRTTLPSVASTQEALLEAARAWSSHTYRVIQEIVATERVYVRDLQDIIQGYVGFLANCEEIQDRLSKQELQDLFGNIMHIYVFNRDLLERLDQSGCDPVRIAQCFVDKSEGFSIYTDYCTNYPSSVEVLTRVMCDDELADIFKMQQLRLQHGLPVGSYLLKPVQRILKYHLLLQSLLKHFDSRQPGHDTLLSALRCMTDVARHTNEMKARHERAVHIQEIQSLLFGWSGADLTTYGELLKEDTFRMHGAKAGRHLYLFEKVLIIAKKKEDGNLLVKDSIQCSNLMVIESVPGEPLSFHVIPFDNPRLQYTMQSRSLEQKHSWCQEMKRLILENFSAVIPDKAKQLVMALGKSKEEQEFAEKDDIVASGGKSNRPHQAPQYLDRRRQRRKSSTTLLDLSLLKGQRVFRMRRPSVAGQLAEGGSRTPTRMHKSNSAENMLDLHESPKEQDEDAPRLLPKSSSIESLHSLVPHDNLSLATDASQHTPSSSLATGTGASPPLCSAAQSARRVQSRDLLDSIDTSLSLFEALDDALVNAALEAKSALGVHAPEKALPSAFITSTKDHNQQTVSKHDPQDRLTHRDSCMGDTESSNEDDSYRSSFLPSFSAPEESLLKVVSNETGITLTDPDEQTVPKSPTVSLSKYHNDAFVALPHLKETKIDGDGDTNLSQNRGSLHSHSASCFDRCTQSQTSTIHRKPPLSNKVSSGSKSRLGKSEKGVSERLLCDNDSSSPLAILGLLPSKKRLSSGSSSGHSQRSIRRADSTPSTSRQSLCSSTSYRGTTTPRSSNSQLNRSPHRVVGDTSKRSQNSPWTLRKDRSTASMKEQEKGGSKTAIQRRSRSNVGDMPFLKNLLMGKHKASRANSFSSLEDTDRTGQIVKKCSGSVNEKRSTDKVEQSQTSPHVSEKHKKLGSSNSFREKFRNMVSPQRAPNKNTTPPRETMNFIYANLNDSSFTNEEGGVQTEKVTVLDGDICNKDVTMSEANETPNSTACDSRSSTLASRDSALDWSSFNDHSYSLDDDTNEDTREVRITRPLSYNESVQYSTTHTSSPVPQESIMSSLRHAVASLTSRITRIGNSTSRGPHHSNARNAEFIRSRSLGAEHDARIVPKPTHKSSEHINLRTSPVRSVGLSPLKASKDRGKEKHSKLVFSLQRAYSERVKKRGRKKGLAPAAHRNSKLCLQDPSLYESTTSIVTTAARLAEGVPKGVVGGSYTLRKPKAKATKKKIMNSSASKENIILTGYKDISEPGISNKDSSKSTSGNHEYKYFDGKNSSYLNVQVTSAVMGSMDKLNREHSSVSKGGLKLPSEIIDLFSKHSNESPFDDCISLHSYYENALEAHLDSDSMRDCVISEDGESMGPDSPMTPRGFAMSTIFDTVQEYKQAETYKIIDSFQDLNRTEENHVIKSIVQGLESAYSMSKPHTREAHKVSVQDSVHKAHIRDRSRELQQCAMLTCIRQDSFEDGLSGNESDIPVCTCANEGENISSCPMHSPSRRGWVKQMITQIQTGHLQSEC